MQTVIDHNRTVAARAVQLNIRVGENRFPVMDRTALATWLVSRLKGARRVSEVQNWDVLRLPDLDQALVAQTLAECPDTLNVLGVDVLVEYRAPYCGIPQAPRVSLPEELVAKMGWTNLPDEGVVLPSGRMVEVSFSIRSGYYGTSFFGTDILQLKEQVRDHLNQGQWDRWVIKPEIVLPNMSDATVTIPEIIADDYGRCVVTGRYLFAYGTVQPYRYYSSDPLTWKSFWTRNWAEAEKMHAKAVAELEKNREAIRLEAQRGQMMEEVESLKTQASELYNLAYNQYYSEFDSDLRTQIYYLRSPSFYSSTGVVEINRWINETKPVLAKAQAEVDRITTQRAEAERIRLETEELEKRELEIILPLVDDRMKVARDILCFAKAVESLKGAVKGACLLRGELSASYGRARRQQVLREALPTLDEYDNASGVLYFNRAADVDLWLEAAATWLESRNGGPVAVSKKSVPKPSSTISAPTSSNGGGFTLADLAGKFSSRR
ncbi:hypothetical protein HYV70_05150 [Candidatus Uhrbacteria bacterium]|nr:hypothetical protein [Candidatus Uhrbacteria bacterium]